MKEELAGKDKRLDSIVLGMDQQFEALSSMMKAWMSKERNPTKEERGGRDRTPLLPNPPIHQRLNTGVEEEAKSCEPMGKISSYILPKIKLNMFSRENPREWTRKFNKYFLLNKVPENHKLLIIEMFLDGKADNWFQDIKLERPKLTRGNSKNCCVKGSRALTVGI